MPRLIESYKDLAAGMCACICMCLYVCVLRVCVFAAVRYNHARTYEVEPLCRLLSACACLYVPLYYAQLVFLSPLLCGKCVRVACLCMHINAASIVLHSEFLVTVLFLLFIIFILPPGNRGFIILLLNVLRLGADVNVLRIRVADPPLPTTHEDYLSTQLRAIAAWNDFYPQLRAFTLQQIQVIS